MYKVSVIVPCYNNEKYIKKAIDSLVNQTLKDIQIIIVDDGSTDNSWQIIKEESVKYPDKIFAYHLNHGNVSTSRNFGLSKIEGEYFGFLDSDDYCELDMFETLYNKAKENDSDICYSDYYLTYVDHEVLYKENNYTNNKEMIVYLYSALWNKIYKTDVFKKLDIKFSESLNEDVIYLFKNAPYINSFTKVDKAFVHYVQRPGSLTHIYDEKVKIMVNNWQMIYEYYKERNIYNEYHDELEYATIKYMLGQTFKRASKIKGKERITTIDLLWNNLNDNFPNWKKNKYLNQFKDLKHTFFKIMNKYNYHLFSKIFNIL